MITEVSAGQPPTWDLMVMTDAHYAMLFTKACWSRWIGRASAWSPLDRQRRHGAHGRHDLRRAGLQPQPGAPRGRAEGLGRPGRPEVARQDGRLHRHALLGAPGAGLGRRAHDAPGGGHRRQAAGAREPARDLQPGDARRAGVFSSVSDTYWIERPARPARPSPSSRRPSRSSPSSTTWHPEGRAQPEPGEADGRVLAHRPRRRRSGRRSRARRRCSSRARRPTATCRAKRS